MTQVTGNLIHILNEPSQVAEVRVAVQEDRPAGTGIALDDTPNATYDRQTGVVAFDAIPGPAILLLKWVGETTSKQFSMLIPESGPATLRECVEAALLADEFTLNALERLALEVTGMVATVQNIALLETWADRAKRDAATARSEADRAEAETATIPQEVQTALTTSLAPTIQSALDASAEPLITQAVTEANAQIQTAVNNINPIVQWPKHLIIGAHLDTIKTPGQYWQDTKSVATPENGYPYYERCSLQVLKNSASDSQTVTQIIITKETHQIAVRDCDAGVWSEWTLYSNEATQLGVTDLDTLTTTQQRIATASTEVNSPNMPKPIRSITDVVGAPDGSVVQTVTALGGVERWWRTRWGTGVWGPWYTDTISEMSLNDDLNKFTASGTFYGVSSATLISLKNLPETARFTLSVVGDGRWYASQTFTNVTNGRAWTRSLNVDTWSEWKENPVGGEAPSPESAPSGTAGLTNLLLREDFTRRRGGRKRISTGAVAFRFDHGLANFDQLIRPLLEERGIPYSQALNSGSWDAAENDGITPEIVDGWVQGGLCEIWNHSRNHIGGVDMAEVEVEVVTGLEELREQLPSAQIDGFVIPGSGGRGFGPGFLMGADVQEFYGSGGGRMILEHHAVSTGYMHGTHLRVLDGKIRQGMGHYTLDKGTLSWAQTLIGYAQADKRGLQFMLHPSLVNEPDHITASIFEQILDHVVAERDAGRIHVCSPYDMYLLDVEPRASVTWSYEGTGTPTLSNYPGIKIGDYIVRKSDGQEWRVDA